LTWQVVIEAPAQAEIAEAFDWYEQRSYGLGGDFLRVIGATAEQLSRNPEALCANARSISQSVVASVSIRAAFRTAERPARLCAGLLASPS
jgi:hypothetical protein